MTRFLARVAVVLFVTSSAGAQSNPTCFSSALPALDRIAACSEVIAADTRHAQAHQARAWAWYELKEYDKAIEDFTQAIAIDPKYVRSFYGRGLTWEKKGKLNNALTDLRYSAAIDPSLADAQQAIARITAAEKRIEAAAAKIAKAEDVSRPSSSASPPPAEKTITTPENISVIQGRKLALVIGNNTYQHVPRLEKAVGDADAVAAALREIGFNVTERTNLDFQQTAALISDFEQGISKSDTVFFHFSGHGVQIRGDNVLLPTDTPQPKEGQQGLVQRFGLSAESVLQGFNERGASLVVAVLDACRENPFATTGTRGIGGLRGLAALSPVEGTFVIYSAGVNQTALDRLGNRDPERTSVFTRAILPLLREPNLSLIEVAKRTQVKVRDLARTVGHEQTPAYYDQVVGNVALVAR
jgi:hypothetical protein